MVNIEREDQDKNRFLDNRPFSNIDMLWGTTSTQLQHVDLSLRSIIWLDYEDSLDRTILDDIRSVISRSVSGTALLITLRCKPDMQNANDPRWVINNLAGALGRERVDVGLTDADLLGWGTASVYRDIVVNDIASALTQRNGARPAPQHLQFEQILNFHYQDGVHMQTMGGIIFDEGQRPIFDQCAFKELEFYRPESGAFRIDVPKLTTRELRFLEAQLPLGEGRSLLPGSMPPRDAEWFKKIYRYFPNFAVVEG